MKALNNYLKAGLIGVVTAFLCSNIKHPMDWYFELNSILEGEIFSVFAWGIIVLNFFGHLYLLKISPKNRYFYFAFLIWLFNYSLSIPIYVLFFDGDDGQQILYLFPIFISVLVFSIFLSGFYYLIEVLRKLDT